MSVIADFGVNGGNPSTVGGAGTTQYFPRLLGTSIGVQSVAPSATSAAGQLVPPGFNSLNGQSFKVRLAGSALSFTGGTAVVSLVINTGTVATPSYTVLASTGAIPTGTVYLPWYLDVSLQGDTLSGLLQGTYVGAQNNTLVDLSAIAAQSTGINFGTGLTSSGNQGVPFGLVAKVVWGASSASNSAKLYQFQVIAD